MNNDEMDYLNLLGKILLVETKDKQEILLLTLFLQKS